MAIRPAARTLRQRGKISHAKMTHAELIAELAYRRDERLALMGFTDPATTPEWAKVQASKEAREAVEKLEEQP